ncbi:MAG: hypothetical protein ACPG49_11145 [Chitinophagales bacterium]
MYLTGKPVSQKNGYSDAKNNSSRTKLSDSPNLYEADSIDPNYKPNTVNTDGWTATQNA